MTFREDDVFNREQLAIQLTEVIENRSSLAEGNTLVIALDSGWGTGKTTFIEKWKSKIEEDGKYVFVNYNAWDDDGFSQPLIALMSEICENFKEQKDNIEIKKRIKYCASKISILLAKGVGKKILEDKLSININEIKKVINDSTGINANDLGAVLNESMSDNTFEEYDIYKSLRDKLRELLTKISRDKPMIFVIDELDRCKPTYAIETLELIKHFFDIDNLCFVLSIDLEQLSHSIATIYGQNMDAEGYLRKFFDINLRMPKPSNKDFISLCSIKYNLTNISQDEDNLYNVWNNLFSKLFCSPRDIDRVMKNVKLLMITSLYNEGLNLDIDVIEFYTFMLILKYKYRDKYKSIINDRFISSRKGINGTFVVIEDIFYKPSAVVESVMKKLSNGGNIQSVSSGDLFYIDSQNDISSVVSKGEYIERKLEMLNV